MQVCFMVNFYVEHEPFILYLSLSIQTVLREFFAQRAAIHAENSRSFALISAGIAHYSLQHGWFDLAEHHLVKIAGMVAVQISEVSFQRDLNRIA